MRRYANRSGNSGVVAYELGKDSITVEFTGGHRYRYTADSAGASNIENMQALAADGRGLAGFISQHVRDCFERQSS